MFRSIIACATFFVIVSCHGAKYPWNDCCIPFSTPTVETWKKVREKGFNPLCGIPQRLFNEVIDKPTKLNKALEICSGIDTVSKGNYWPQVKSVIIHINTENDLIDLYSRFKNMSSLEMKITMVALRCLENWDRYSIVSIGYELYDCCFWIMINRVCVQS
jgi:hypothetical protein